jgi:hypothetical protein
MKILESYFLFIITICLLSTDLGAKDMSVSYPDYFPDAVSYEDWHSSEKVSAPGFLTSIIDPDTHFRVWRLGGSAKEMASRVPHPKGNDRITITHAQHFYSRINPTNKDETYVIGAAGRGTSYAALWRLSDKQLVGWVPTANPEANLQQRQIIWDKEQRNVYWFTESSRLIRVTLDLNSYQAIKSEVWAEFPEYEFITFGYGEGTFSDTGEQLVLVGKSSGEGKTKSKSVESDTIISYLVKQKKIKATKVIPHVNHWQLDWAAVDPTGEYVVFNRPDQGRSTWVLPFDLKGKPRMLYKHMKHSDFVIDQKGQSWIVFGNWQGVFATQLSKPFLKRVWPTYVDIGAPEKYDGEENISAIEDTASGHVSRVADVAGMVLITRFIDGGFYLINIDDPGKTIHVGSSHHGLPKTGGAVGEWGINRYGEPVDPDGNQDYLREPRGSSSASGKYVFFVSDYHIYDDYSQKPELKAYLNMIELSNTKLDLGKNTLK